MKFAIVTNNELVRNGCDYPVDFVNGTYRDVLVRVRDKCHCGFKLLSHPLSGSVKPSETPYKSVLISLKPQSNIDEESILLIEKAIKTCDKFTVPNIFIREKYKADFELIDSTLIKSAIESAIQVNY